MTAPPDLAVTGMTSKPETELDIDPGPPGRLPGPGPWRQMVRAWRQLTSMRTALLLLFLLALAAVPGSILPQRPVDPIEVDAYVRDNPGVAPLLDRLGLFNVFAAPWFAAVYLLLMVSLVGCLGPRLRLHAAAVRARPPAAPRHLNRLGCAEKWETSADAGDAATAARRILRGRRFRTLLRTEADGAVAVAAEKGYLRETGNLVFHLALVALLVGVALGALTGYRGTVLVVEGDAFANSVSSYDNYSPGRLTEPGDLAPFEFGLLDFRATYLDNGQPLTFEADVTYRAAFDAPERARTVRVNSPLDVAGARVFLLGHGYAPRFTVIDEVGNRIETGAVPFLPQDGRFTSTGVVKVPDAQGKDPSTPAQIGLDASFLPTVAAQGAGRLFTSVSPEPRAPAVSLLAYKGDLGEDSGIPGSVYRLRTRGLGEPVAAGLLTPGQTMPLPGGGSVTLDGYQEWATFQVTDDPGKLVALGAATAVLVGLLLSLFVRRRRVWVRLREAPVPAGGDPGGRRTLVEIGGLSRSDTEAFAREFGELAGRLRAAVPPAAPAHANNPAPADDPAPATHPARSTDPARPEE